MDLRVNGTVIDAAAIGREAEAFADSADPDAAARRALALRELILQRAGALGFLDDGVSRAAVTFASREQEDALIARVLEREVTTPVPSEDECRRFHAAHPQRFTSGELVEARHILFAVTSRVPVMALRQRAEAVLAELRQAPDRFAQRAGELSNCPSGAQGGNLGQFGRGSMVPEFDRAIFGVSTVGVLPELVTTRHGFHVVEIVHRLPGKRVPFEAVAERVAALLAREVEAKALAQYARILAGQAKLEGVALEVAPTPLVQ